MSKTKLAFIPTAYSFSDFTSEDGDPFDTGTNDHEDKMYAEINENLFVINVLTKLNDRHKIVFMFLLLRELGYNLTHEECAKTMSISRQAYMKLVKTIRMKTDKILQGSRG
jgi:DNA-directed RNA polymerase specialized sigma subunit